MAPPLPSELWGGAPETSSPQAYPGAPYGVPSGVGTLTVPNRREVLTGGGAAAVGALLPTQTARRVTTGDPDAVTIALAEVKRYEGYKGRPVLFAYDDAVFPPTPAQPGEAVRGTLTIGWGRAYGVEAGETCTEAQADAMLLDDISGAMNAVWSLEAECTARGHPRFSPEQAAALCSFAYNIGWHDLRSTRSVAGRLRAGDYAGAAQGLSLYVYGRQDGQKVRLRGLVSRRERERALFLSGMEGDPTEETEATERATPVSPEKPLAGSSTVWAGTLSAFGLVGGYFQNLTGIAPTYQGVGLAIGVAIGLGGIVWAVVERIRKHRRAEGW